VTVLQVIGLVAVVLGGTAVVFTPEALAQTMVLGIYGIALTFLFFVFQAPDVALSEIVVSSIGLPLIILAALRKIRQQDDRRSASGSAADRESDRGGKG
jgi:energy-converting hydrogenase B subunit D